MKKVFFLTQLQVFALLCLYLLEVRGLERGPLVKTITSTSMLDRLGELYKVPVFETPVGFKYVAPVMIAQNALIGRRRKRRLRLPRPHSRNGTRYRRDCIFWILWLKPARRRHNY